MARHAAKDAASQTKYPWRATIRTIIQTVPAVAVLVPAVVAELPAGETTAWAVAAVSVSGVVARVMAIPGVNALLTQFGLGAEPKAP